MKLVKTIIILLCFFLPLSNLIAQPEKEGTSAAKPFSLGKKKDKIPSNFVPSDSGTSPDKPFPIKPKISLDWANLSGATIPVSGGMIDIAMKVKTSKAVTMKDIVTYVNGKRLDSKANETDLFGNGEDYNYKNKVKLQQGVNKIEVAIETPTIKKRSSAKIVEYNNGIATMSGEEGGGTKELNAFWKTPDPIDLGGKPLAQKEMLLNISIGIVSAASLTLNDLTLVVNNNYFSPTKVAQLKREGSQYSYTDQVLLDDKVSINEIFIKAVKGANIAKTATLKVNYSPEKPNLYVLSIGVKSNLQYTVNDANDFTDIFSGQGGRDGNHLFNAIQIEKLLGEDATAEAMKKKIIDLKIKMETGNISKNDLIILYVSTHGFIGADQDLRLEGNDYEARYKDITSISYKKDVLARLDEIPCKKVIFIDACHSGGAKADAANITDALTKFKEIPIGLSVITSSQESEQSYEDDKWENGAFTEAIVKGLVNGEADANENKIITLKELYEFISKEVPMMVTSVKNKSQRPSMPKKDLENIGIFVVPD
jgi:hypothetical protein